eukprot:SAG31_NODE_4027_length_3652_cov_3.901773_2_plen_48_part_00
MGFVMEKLGGDFACVPECVFAGGVVNYESYLCECSEGAVYLECSLRL